MALVTAAYRSTYQIFFEFKCSNSCSIDFYGGARFHVFILSSVVFSARNKRRINTTWQHRKNTALCKSWDGQQTIHLVDQYLSCIVTIKELLSCCTTLNFTVAQSILISNIILFVSSFKRRYWMRNMSTRRTSWLISWRNHSEDLPFKKCETKFKFVHVWFEWGCWYYLCTCITNHSFTGCCLALSGNLSYCLSLPLLPNSVSSWIQFSSRVCTSVLTQ